MRRFPNKEIILYQQLDYSFKLDTPAFTPLTRG